MIVQPLSINKTLGLGFAFVVMAIIVLFLPAGYQVVAMPGMICLFLVIALWFILWNRDGAIPFFDIGFFCALATCIYAVYPLVNYMLDGLQFGLLSDNRLRNHEIKPAELGLFHYRHVVYIFFFVLSYAFFRKPGIGVSGVKYFMPKKSLQFTIVFFFIFFSFYFVALGLATGINYNASYETDTYAKNATAFANAPLVVIQISTKFAGILFLFKLSLVYLLILQCHKKGWRRLLILWVFLEIINAFVLKGSRSGMILFLLGTALFYHQLVKPFSIRFLLISGSMLFVFFIFLGLYRMYSDLASLQTDLSGSDAGLFGGGNEFQALLGTSYDVLQFKKQGVPFPAYLYFNDIITILPPQQLLPIEKVPASEWYLRQLGINGDGSGFMWGVISQSIIGGDWIELAFRGSILAWLLAQLHNWYQKNQRAFFVNIFYVYMCLRIYYTFRDTTFSVLAYIVWEYIPFFLLTKLLVQLLSPKQYAVKERQESILL